MTYAFDLAERATRTAFSSHYHDVSWTEMSKCIAFTRMKHRHALISNLVLALPRFKDRSGVVANAVIIVIKPRICVTFIA